MVVGTAFWSLLPLLVAGTPPPIPNWPGSDLPVLIMVSKGGKVPIGDTSYCGDASRPFWINENFVSVCNCPRDITKDSWTNGCMPGSTFRVYTPCPGGLAPLNKSDDKVEASFSYYGGSGVITNAHVDLHYRGQSSKCLNPQKSYTVKFKDNETSLGGLPASDEWALYAPYIDRSYARNTFIFELSRYGSDGTDGMWAPNTRYVEVFVTEDGNTTAVYPQHYKGVFVLMQKLDQGKTLVDVPKVKKGKVKGGYIIKFDKETRVDDVYFTYPLPTMGPDAVATILNVYPGAPSNDQQKAISTWMRKLSDFITGPDFATKYSDGTLKYQKYMNSRTIIGPLPPFPSRSRTRPSCLVAVSTAQG